MRELDDITDAIISAAIEIHRELGPGLLESVYEAVLARDLARRGFHVQRQTLIRFEYDGMVFDEGFRTDLIVQHQVATAVANTTVGARRRRTPRGV